MVERTNKINLSPRESKTLRKNKWQMLRKSVKSKNNSRVNSLNYEDNSFFTNMFNDLEDN